MRWNILALSVLTVLSPLYSAAQTQESLKAGSASGFVTSVVRTAQGTPAVNGQDPNWLALLKAATAQYFRAHTFQIQPQGKMDKAAAPIAALELPRLRNKQWDSPAALSMSGAVVRLSGQFSRAGNAFFAAQLANEKTPRFFSLDDLLEGTPRLGLGASTYQVILVPDLLDRLGSRVAFRNLSDANDGHGLIIRHILDLVYSAGSPVAVGGQDLRVFYGQDVDDAVVPARACNCESVAILSHSGDEYFTYLIPLEWIPTSGSPALFDLRGTPIALLRKATTLQFFQP